MAATAFDLEHPETVAHELAEANRRLARERTVPESVLAIVEDVAHGISETEDAALVGIDPFLWIAVQRAALHAQQALRADETERRARLRLALEQMRFLLSRLAERAPMGEEQPVAEVVRWLDDKLPVSQQLKADLLGVSERTYQRWVSDRESSSQPSGDDERRVRVVARIVGQLRHSLTGPGVIDWFGHPRVDLDGDKPQDALTDPRRTDELLRAALASRAQVAA
jgi:DNA-binding transcriptional regulator YiaG